jgi:hypothetical protein
MFCCLCLFFEKKIKQQIKKRKTACFCFFLFQRKEKEEISFFVPERVFALQKDFVGFLGLIFQTKTQKRKREKFSSLFFSCFVFFLFFFFFFLKGFFIPDSVRFSLFSSFFMKREKRKVKRKERFFTPFSFLFFHSLFS